MAMKNPQSSWAHNTMQIVPFQQMKDARDGGLWRPRVTERARLLTQTAPLPLSRRASDPAQISDNLLDAFVD
jgi:hypothetical protein